MSTAQSSVWALAKRQHGIVTRSQLLELGFSANSIQHRIDRGRLHGIWRGVYALGRPALTSHGRWMAAVLACGQEAALSHTTAAALWDLRHATSQIHISVPANLTPRQPGIVIHRRVAFEATRRHGIPVTTPICTLVDLAKVLNKGQLERAISEADSLGLTDPYRLRSALDKMTPRPGLAVLRQTLDTHTFVLTDSELERLFVPIALRAGLSKPLTGQHVNAPAYVQATLAAVAARLRSEP